MRRAKCIGRSAKWPRHGSNDMLTEKLGFFFVAAYLFVTDRKTSASAAVTETSLLWAEVLKKFPSA
jgi:hypothetical protein